MPLVVAKPAEIQPEATAKTVQPDTREAIEPVAINQEHKAAIIHAEMPGPPPHELITVKEGHEEPAPLASVESSQPHDSIATEVMVNMHALEPQTEASLPPVISEISTAVINSDSLDDSSPAYDSLPVAALPEFEWTVAPVASETEDVMEQVPVAIEAPFNEFPASSASIDNVATMELAEAHEPTAIAETEIITVPDFMTELTALTTAQPPLEQLPSSSASVELTEAMPTSLEIEEATESLVLLLREVQTDYMELRPATDAEPAAASPESTGPNPEQAVITEDTNEPNYSQVPLAIAEIPDTEQAVALLESAADKLLPAVVALAESTGLALTQEQASEISRLLALRLYNQTSFASELNSSLGSYDDQANQAYDRGMHECLAIVLRHFKQATTAHSLATQQPMHRHLGRFALDSHVFDGLGAILEGITFQRPVAA